MDALTPMDPALKRDQMLARGLYAELVAHINDPKWEIPFQVQWLGPIPQSDIDMINERFRAQPSEEKYVVTYIKEGYIDSNECPSARHYLRVDFSGPKQSSQ